MQLKELTFEEKCTGWKLQRANFDKITLLVGASGVGKTKILECINTLYDIASGKSFNGITWDAIFFDNKLGSIRWTGETEKCKDTFDIHQIPINFGIYKNKEKNNDKIIFNFLSERITINDVEIFRRDAEKSIFKTKETIKLTQDKSLLTLLHEDEVINIKNAFSIKSARVSVHYALRSDIIEGMHFSSFSKLVNDDNIELIIKLFIAYTNFKKDFLKIKNEFTSIFPFVEDIRFGSPEVLTKAKNNPAPELTILQLKEVHSKNWICSWHWSSGMRKVLSLIASIYLTPQNSIVLIDEFENSLGVNCIDAVTGSIASGRLGNQLILVSHHPYIINNIPVDKWRLVTRKKNLVEISSVKEKLSTISKHDYFLQLTNLDEYAEGTTI